MKTNAPIGAIALSIAMITAIGFGATLADAQPRDQAYYYGLTQNEWWVAQAHVGRAAATRSTDTTGNRRAPFAAPVNANGQGTN